MIKSGLVTLADTIPLPGPPDDQTLRELLEGVRPRLKRLLRSYDIPPEDAEDIVQEALLDALRKWDTIRQKDAWLLGTVRFKCSNYWKRRRGDRVEACDLRCWRSSPQPQAPDQEQTEISLDLRSLTRGVDGRHRAALWLRFGVGLSPAEVARQLGYSPPASAS